MRILAIETVGTTGSVAALEDDRLLAEQALDPSRRSAQTLAPAIAQLLARVGWKRNDIELVAVATGPGSFTGLRIGVTTAKTIAYAIGCPAVGVHTLRAIAADVPRPFARFSAVVDAQRGELFVADFCRPSEGELAGEETTRIVGRAAWLAGLQAGDVVTGPGLSPLVEQLPPGVVAIDRRLWGPTAAAVGRVGRGVAAAREAAGVFDLVPRYFRRTAAEEQWERRQAGAQGPKRSGPK